MSSVFITFILAFLALCVVNSKQSTIYAAMVLKSRPIGVKSRAYTAKFSFLLQLRSYFQTLCIHLVILEYLFLNWVKENTRKSYNGTVCHYVTIYCNLHYFLGQGN